MTSVLRAADAFDLRNMEIFLAVAELGSMSAAAERLGLTQSAVSRAVARLEAALGGEVVDRAQRPMRPTAAGEHLTEGARRLLADRAALRERVREIADATLPQVRLGMIDSFAGAVGPGLIRRLRGTARHLTVWAGISPNLGPDLVVGRRLDAVVTSDAMAGLEGVERARLITEPFILVVPATLARASRGQVRLEDLVRNHPLVRYSVRSMIGAQIEAYLESLGLNAPPAMEFDGTENVFAMVSGGLGWALSTPLCLAHGRAGARGLEALPLPGPGMTRSLYLVSRAGELTGLADRLVSGAREVLSDMHANDFAQLVPWAVDDIRIG